MTEKKKGFLGRVRDYFFEEVTQTETPVAEEKKESIDQILEEIQSKPVEEEKKEVKEEIKAEVKPVEKPQQKFIEVSKPAQQQPVAEVKKEEKPRPVWRPVDVISPIFGASTENTFVGFNTSGAIDEDEVYASTVVSPINGRETIRKVVDDIVDEKIASMTTSDFINKVEDVKPVVNNYVEVEEVVMPQMKEETVYYQQPVKVEKVEKQPVKDLDATQGYENLSLFD